MINPVAFVLTFGIVIWCSTEGRRVCFKEQFDNGKCFAPIRESLIERPSQFISGDCCLFSNAMYYANTNASEAQIRFFGVQCSQCTKNQTAYSMNPCEGKVCPRGKVCRDKGNGRTKCVCHGCHGRAYQPVCGTNGETYDNECALKRKACREGRPNVEVAYEGRCRTGCADVVCRRNRTCMIDQYQKAYCVACVDCSKYARKGGPVCGADGLQYDSSCHLRMETCRQGKTIGEAYNGKCIANATCDIITCDMTSDSFFDPSMRLIKKQCVQDDAGRPRCVTCSCEGSDALSKNSWSTIVCGSDNKTYVDYCSLKTQMCRTKRFIDVRHPGPCRGDALLVPQDEQTPSQVGSKPCDQEDVTMYYVTMKQFVSILKNDFGIDVTPPPKHRRRKFRDKIVLVKTLIKSLSKKWIKISQQ